MHSRAPGPIDQLGGFIATVTGTITTAIIVLLIFAYTYGVAKVSAQVGIDARGNPLKEKALSLALGVEPPEGDFNLLDSITLPTQQCEVPVDVVDAGEENKFLEAFVNLFGERPEVVE